MASLKITGEGVDEKFDLGSSTVTLGRGLEAEVRLKDIKASRRHCQVVKAPDGYKLVDLSSGNGTYLNGAQVREQKLNPGDKIQIGSTTITFEDAAPPKAAAPAKAPAAAAPTKGNAGKIAVATPAAKPTTGKVPAATAPPRAGTDKIAIAQTQITGRKPGTQGIGKPSTGRKITGRITTASQKFRAEARRPKTSQVKVLMVVIAVIFLAVVGVILFWPTADPEIIKARIEKLQIEAHKLEADGKLDEAVKKWQEAVDLVKEFENYKGYVAETKTRIESLKQDAIALQKVDEKWLTFKRNVDKAEKGEKTDVALVDLLKTGKELEGASKSNNLPWKKDLEVAMVKVSELMKEAGKVLAKLQFQVFRNELYGKYKLEDRDFRAEWGPAIKAIKGEYLTQEKVPDEERKKAEAEIENLNRRANEEVIRCRTRANNKVADGQKAEAVDFLKKQRPRFEGAKCAEDLEKLVSEIDK